MAKRTSGNSLEQRKRRLASRLENLGIDDAGFSDINTVTKNHILAGPQQVALRLLILLACSFTAYRFEESDRVVEWLKKEGLWKSAAESEKEFFRSPDPSEQAKGLLSWRFEGAYELAWILNAVTGETDPAKESSELQVSEFISNIPTVGMPTAEFCHSARMRPANDIIDEYIFYERIQAYLDDIQVSQQENTAGVHLKASMERINVLRWVFGFEGNTEWDEIIAEDDDY